MIIFLSIVLYLLIGGLLASWFYGQEWFHNIMYDDAREVFTTKERFTKVTLVIVVIMWLPALMHTLFRRTKGGD